MRGTVDDDEIDVAMLGTRLPPVPAAFKALRTVELLLHFLAWVGVIATMVLDGEADGFDPAKVVGEMKHYSWRTSTVDAAIVTFAAAIVAAITALAEYPSIGLLLSSVACVAAVAKRIMLAADESALRSWCVVAAVVATACLSLAMLLQALRARRRRQALALMRLEHDLETTTTTTEVDARGAALPRPNTYTRRRADGQGKGASIGRLLALAGPERCQLIVATVMLAGSTASTTAMPALGLVAATRTPQCSRSPAESPALDARPQTPTK